MPAGWPEAKTTAGGNPSQEAGSTGFDWEYPEGASEFEVYDCWEGEAQLPIARPNTETQQSMLRRCLVMLSSFQNRGNERGECPVRTFSSYRMIFAKS
jgi:hypothetical protein